MRNPFFSGALLLLLVFGFSQCSYTQKIRDGATAFKQKQYDVAIDMLKKEYDREKSRVNQGKLAYMLGESYRETNQIDKAIQWYKQAYDYAYGFEALREYAYALKQDEQYEEAMQAFKNLGIEIGSPYEYRKEITACSVAIEWQKDPNKEYIVELAEFNTAFADYAPALYGEDQLVFTSDRRNATGEDTYNWTGNNFSDLFLLDLASQSVQVFDPNLNSDNNEGTAVFNKDFNEVYFTRCFSGEKYADNFCKLMMSRKTGNSWTVPVVLNFVEEETNYGHPALSADGNTLYFSANHREGWGGYDLYFSIRTPDGWDYPRLMNRSINTPRNEQFPFVDADTLYFASDGHTGMGGLDIFKTYKLANGSWSPAQNLKTPINSGQDDFAFVIDRRQEPSGDILQTGYFTSTRAQGIGNDDIYQFTRRTLPEEPEIVETPTAYKMILNGYVLEKIYQVAEDPNSKILGRKPLNEAEVEIVFRDTSYKVTVGENGFFSLELEERMDYYFLASKDEYLKNENRFSTKGIGKDPNMPVQTFEIEIELDRIFKNTEITLEDIYYDFDEWFIRDDAKPTLNKLAENLLLNPDIKIRMASHTDCRGNDRYNEDLSQKRAQSAVDYLISKGISAERLSAKGFGEGVPNVDCLCSRCTEDEHQQNRRTTFAIIE